MVGDDVDDAAPQHWRMRQQDELDLMERILVAWVISVQLQWDELYLMKRGLDDAAFLLGLKVDPVPSDPVGAKNRKDDDEALRHRRRDGCLARVPSQKMACARGWRRVM